MRVEEDLLADIKEDISLGDAEENYYDRKYAALENLMTQYIETL